jgi:hypothetical protein
MFRWKRKNILLRSCFRIDNMCVARRLFPEQLLQKVTTILSDLWGNRISIILNKYLLSMKKILLLIGILFCLYSCKITEKISAVEKVYLSRMYNLPDSLTYQVIEITNPIMYQMLDSIIELSKTCLFTIHNQPVRYSFYSAPKEDTVFFFFCAEQYDDDFYDTNYDFDPERWEKYCFVYKGIWFTGNVYPDNSESIYFNNFFKLTDKEKKLNIYLPEPEIYYCGPLNPVFLFIDYVGIRYGTYNNAIVGIQVRPCQNLDVVYHTVKRKDTVKKLAEKYQTIPRRILQLNSRMFLEFEMPVGKRIRVQ